LLEDGDLVSVRCQNFGGSQAADAGADNGDLHRARTSEAATSNCATALLLQECRLTLAGTTDMDLDMPDGMATALVSLTCFATITWISKSQFVSKGPLPPAGTIVIVCAALTSVLVFLWSISTAPRATVGPMLLYVAALALFLWATSTTRHKGFLPSFSNVVPGALTTEGPYRFVRHPFYVSYLFYHLGNALATAAWMPWVMLAAMAGIYVVAAHNEEGYLAQGAYADDYDAYKRRTGMFFPRILPALRR
jgi:protein-S-isoprenylcysteine O-methyltransferase Ste14